MFVSPLPPPWLLKAISPKLPTPSPLIRIRDSSPVIRDSGPVNLRKEILDLLLNLMFYLIFFKSPKVSKNGCFIIKEKLMTPPLSPPLFKVRYSQN